MALLTKYNWYYQRLRTMSLPEVGFRVRQTMQRYADKSRMGWWPVVNIDRLPNALLPVGDLRLFDTLPPIQSRIFNHVVDGNQPIDWHLDLSTNRRFPMDYAPTIDIRTDAVGNAKYVWEVNRLPFLPALALHYKQTGDRAHLAQFIALTTDWLTTNPYLTGVNWYSNIEVNLRLINWFCCWNILDASVLVQTDSDFADFVNKRWLPSIYQHCVYSYANPSFHSSANNHLISEYAGLFIAASFWKFTESETWCDYAKAGLEREIQTQHRRGVNREETAAYIQFITDFFLIAYVVGERSGNSFSTNYANQLRQIGHYIAQFLDCRGNLPRYGDEDNGRVVTLDNNEPDANFRSILTTLSVLFSEPLFKQRAGGTFDLKSYLLLGDSGQQQFDQLPLTETLLKSQFYTEEGHFIFRKQAAPDREIYGHFDAAPLGFLSIAAHGHADALSFSLHVDGEIFLGDAGTYTYHTEPDWRNYFVSTRAHNTVCIDGENHAFQGGALLWLNHYTPTVLRAETTDTHDEVVATHNGYDRLRCQHQRTVRFHKATDTILITDQVSNNGDTARLVEVLFHLGPNIKPIPARENQFLLQSTDSAVRSVTIQIPDSLKVELVHGQTEPFRMGWYSNRFYQKQPTHVIRAYQMLDPHKSINHQHTIDINPFNNNVTL